MPHVAVSSVGFMKMNLKPSHHQTIGLGILLVLPFLIFNYLVSSSNAQFLRFIRPEGHTSNLEMALLIGSLTLALCAGIVALLPMRSSKDSGTRTVYLINLVFGVSVIIATVVIVYALGIEMYACNVMNAPNCD